MMSQNLSDAEVLGQVLAAVAGRPGLAAVEAAASALAARQGASTPSPADCSGEFAAPGRASASDARVDVIFDAEIVDDVPASRIVGDYTAAGVPTWDRVRDSVENRSGTAIGHEELDHISPAGRSIDEQWNERQEAARKKLDAIRQSMKER